ncbi:alpha/beta fold hydrolase [Allopusillimonas ginsengisoli]|uniref:alpha/beta fold hydrolase n=1 Tax=Allopusillimonas ginsengisoli TaxID=453575 RepID=UPI00101EC1B7|nr:alpha/beta fold hydrolase [Allopusillimonas ginsengisoli]TEA77977.1 alpha/beta fold hydrolase [Allopusillimonas ginsengisoli]
MTSTHGIERQPDTTAATFVLVHGAWNGGWCWSRVAEQLRQSGHKVYTPTLTGLGERSHLLTPDIDLQTFIHDVVNVLVWEDLNDVILVGHSFGGVVISGVADVAADRIRQLIYLDAFILESGVSTMDTLSPDNQEKLRQGMERTGGAVPALAPPRPQSLGITDDDDVAFVQGRLMPQPYKSYTSALALQHPLGNGLPCCYVQCVNPVFPAVAASANWAREQDNWRIEPLVSSHCAMVTAPRKLGDLLLELAVAGHQSDAPAGSV